MVGRQFGWWLAGAMIVLTLCGCGKRLRPAAADRLLVADGRGVVQQAAGIEATVIPVQVPWASSDGPIGFWIEVVNLLDRPIRIGPGNVVLRDTFGRMQEPIPPDVLRRSFGSESGGSARRAAHRPCIVRRRYYRHYPYRPYYGPYGFGHPYHWYGYGGWGYCGAYEYDYGYAESVRTGKFLSELLTEKIVEPNHVIAGHVVFTHSLENDDQLDVLLRLPWRSADQDSPTHEQADRSDGTTLEFQFEIR